MADIGTFPTIYQVVDQGHQNCLTMTAGAAIKAGQVVAYAKTGVSKTVHPHIPGITASIVGVAMYDAASGAEVPVLTNGAVVYVANADDTTGIDAGALVGGNDNAVGGTVSAASTTATTVHGTEYAFDILGIALDDIAGDATGRVMIALQATTRAT